MPELFTKVSDFIRAHSSKVGVFSKEKGDGVFCAEWDKHFQGQASEFSEARFQRGLGCGFDTVDISLPVGLLLAPKDAAEVGYISKIELEYKCTA